jgi:hypothetical protein
MEHLFADYEVSTLVKEKGFDEPCLAIYQIFETYGEKGIIEIGELQIQTIKKGFKSDTSIAAPLWGQIIEWLREVHNIEIVITGIPIYDIRKYWVCLYRMIDNIMTDDSLLFFDEKTDEYKGYQTFTYPEARRTAILHALTLI